MSLDSELREQDRPEREQKPAKPHRVRTTRPGNKVIFESLDPREVRKFVENNFPRKHHEAEDHDVFVQHPDGTKHVFNTGEGEDGWSDYRSPADREDD